MFTQTRLTCFALRTFSILSTKHGTWNCASSHSNRWVEMMTSFMSLSHSSLGRVTCTFRTAHRTSSAGRNHYWRLLFHERFFAALPRAALLSRAKAVSTRGAAVRCAPYLQLCVHYVWTQSCKFLRLQYCTREFVVRKKSFQYISCTMSPMHRFFSFLFL